MFQFPRSTAFFWYGLSRTDAAAAAAAAAGGGALKQKAGGAATACERARALLLDVGLFQVLPSAKAFGLADGFSHRCTFEHEADGLQRLRVDLGRPFLIRRPRRHLDATLRCNHEN